MLWNPYLGQTRWIQPIRRAYDRSDVYALGYDKSTNRNHVTTKSWGIVMVPRKMNLKSTMLSPIHGGLLMSSYTGAGAKSTSMSAHRWKETLNYFLDRDGHDEMFTGFLVCYDFTMERFGELLPLPWSSYNSRVTPISCFQEEKLAALYMPSPISGMGIWVTTKAEPNELLWSTSLKLIWKLFPVLIVFKLAVSSLMKRRNGLFFFLMAVLPIPSPRGILQRSLHHWREWLL